MVLWALWLTLDPRFKLRNAMPNEAFTHFCVNRLMHTLLDISILPRASIPAVFDLLNQLGDRTSFRKIVSILDLILIIYWEKHVQRLRVFSHGPTATRWGCTEVGWVLPRWPDVHVWIAQSLRQWIGTVESAHQSDHCISIVALQLLA